MRNTRKVVIDNKSIIFMDYKKLALEYLSRNQRAELEHTIDLIFRDFLRYKLFKYELHKDLDNSNMALGERVCVNLAFLIAIRRFVVIEFLIPAKNCLSFLDVELRKGVSESLFYKELVM